SSYILCTSLESSTTRIFFFKSVPPQPGQRGHGDPSTVFPRRSFYWNGEPPRPRPLQVEGGGQVAPHLLQRVATHLLEQGIGDHQGQHRLGHHPAGRQRGDVAALVLRAVR